MAIRHTILERITVGNVQLDKSQVIDSGGNAQISEAVPVAASDLEIFFGLDVSEVRSFYMMSDQDITIETNDGSSPDDTIVLKANVPYIWHVDSYHTFLFGTDITALYATNASGESATLTIHAGYDPTP